MGPLSKSDRKILESSVFVKKITAKHVTYTQDFIEIMLKGPSQKGMTKVEFFNHTLGVHCFDPTYVDSTLGRWRKTPILSNQKESRGRKKNIQKMSLEELKAENAYQREVIAQLKKIHGLTDSDL